MNQTSTYKSSITTIITFIGVSVGLGNVWRFPYMMGSYGGSAFLFVYLMFTLLFAIPALMAEIALGRTTGGGIISAFVKSAGQPLGRVIGYILLITITISGSYYLVVVSNVIFTTGYFLLHGFSGQQITQYSSYLSNGWLQYLVTLLTLFLSLVVIHRGMRRGIEMVSNIIVPMFVLSVLYLIGFTVTIPGALEELHKFLQPNWSALHSKEIFAALGQAFYSVGLGGTFMVAYGRFVKPGSSIPKLALFTSLGDMGASLMVSFFLVPVILISGLDMATGPRLIFNTLPRLFSLIPAGWFTGAIFLLALSLIAFLSLVAAYQVAVSSFDRDVNDSHTTLKVVILIGVVQALLSLPSNLYPSLIGTLDLWFGSGMQILGSILAILALSWGMGKQKLMFELFNSRTLGIRRELAAWWIRYAVPLTLIAVLAGYIYESLAG